MASSYFMLKMLKRKREACKKKLQNEDEEHTEPFSLGENDLGADTSDVNKCRTCLKEGTISIYGNSTKCDLPEAIRTLGGVEITEEDEYPKHLCVECHSLLRAAILFRESAIQTDKILRQNLPQHEHISDIECNDEITENEAEDNKYNTATINTYICKICKLNFKSIEEYVSHKKSKQHKNVRVQCTICKRLLTARFYKNHLLRHQSASHLVCEVCGKLYRKDNLIRHLRLHSSELPFKCKVCPYRGRFLESLRIHMRTHTGDKPFSCEQCCLKFLTRSNLNRHLLTHKKERPFKCIECGRGFYTKHDMDMHFRCDHVGIKDYCCRMCGSKYGTRNALMRHELRVHKRDKMAKGRMPLYLRAEYRNQKDVSL